jgi:hypothetical protein
LKLIQTKIQADKNGAIDHLVVSKPNMAVNDGEGKHMVMEGFGFTVIFRSSKYLHKTSNDFTITFFALKDPLMFARTNLTPQSI